MVGPDHLLISVVWNDRKYDRRGMGRVMIDCIRRRSDFRAVAWSSPVFVSNLPAAAGVPTDNHNQSLFGASGWPAVRLQANVVLQGSNLEKRHTRRHIQRGDINIRKMLWNGPALPIVVLVRMCQPVVEARSNQLTQIIRGERRKIEKYIVAWRNPLLKNSMRIPAQVVAECVLCHTSSPEFTEHLFERTALVNPAVVIIAARYHGANPC
jgi:hypothetical protein